MDKSISLMGFSIQIHSSLRPTGDANFHFAPGAVYLRYAKLLGLELGLGLGLGLAVMVRVMVRVRVRVSYAVRVRVRVTTLTLTLTA